MDDGSFLVILVVVIVALILCHAFLCGRIIEGRRFASNRIVRHEDSSRTPLRTSQRENIEDFDDDKVNSTIAGQN